MQRSFSRQVASLDEVFAFVDTFLDRERVDSEHHDLVRFVIEELFTNAVRHARGGTRPVEIELRRGPDRLTMSVRDFDGEPFDPTRLPAVDVEQPIAQRRPGGLGVHLIRQMTDGFDYAYEDGCSTVTVTKRTGDSHV